MQATETEKTLWDVLNTYCTISSRTFEGEVYLISDARPSAKEWNGTGIWVSLENGRDVPRLVDETSPESIRKTLEGLRKV